MELARLGKIEPIIGARLPLEQLEQALQLARDNQVFGRVMLDVNDAPSA